MRASVANYTTVAGITPSSANACVEQRAPSLPLIETRLSKTSTILCLPVGYSPRDCSNALLEADRGNNAFPRKRQ
jgi:hypothetical protein